MTERPNGDWAHLGIAERGKVYAVAGDHAQALRHYREAMRMAVSREAPEVFFRHYLECTIESLELMGSHGEVHDYCRRAIPLHDARLRDAVDEDAAELARRDLATTWQRLGVNLLAAGQRTEARSALESAVALVDADVGPLKLARVLLGWLRGGLHVRREDVLAQQRRHGYFTVREETIDHGRVIDLPPAVIGPAMTPKGG